MLTETDVVVVALDDVAGFAVLVPVVAAAVTAVDADTVVQLI